MGRSAAWWRRLLGWPEPTQEPADQTVEYPWHGRWDRVAKRSAGPDFTRADYSEARRRAREVAQATLGPELWAELQGPTLRIGTTDPAQVQPVIDALRTRGLVVRRVQMMRPSLEELFIETVTDSAGRGPTL